MKHVSFSHPKVCRFDLFRFFPPFESWTIQYHKMNFSRFPPLISFYRYFVVCFGIYWLYRLSAQRWIPCWKVIHHRRDIFVAFYLWSIACVASIEESGCKGSHDGWNIACRDDDGCRTAANSLFLRGRNHLKTFYVGGVIALLLSGSNRVDGVEAIMNTMIAWLGTIEATRLAWGRTTRHTWMKPTCADTLLSRRSRILPPFGYFFVFVAVRRPLLLRDILQIIFIE